MSVYLGEVSSRELKIFGQSSREGQSRTGCRYV